MTLKSKTYRLTDIFTLAFQVAPIWGLLLLIQRLIGALLPAILVLVTADFIDTATQIVQGDLANANLIAPLLLLSGLVLYQWLLTDINKFFDSKLLIATRNTYKLALLTKRSQLAYRHIENADTYDLIKRVFDPSDTKIMDMFKSTLALAHILIQAASLVAIIAVHAWWAAVAILAFSIPLFLIGWKAGKNNYTALSEAKKMKRQADYYLNIASSREAVDERALFGYTPKIVKDMDAKNQIAVKMIQKGMKNGLLRIGIGGIVTTLISVFVMAILIYPLSVGTITAGLFMALINACANLSYALGWPLTQNLAILKQNLEYLKDLSAFSGLEEAAGATHARSKSVLTFESLKFDNVSFTYPGTNKLILDGVSFTMTAGKQYAFVGENGAGKTTIIKLLTGQYPEYGGSIYLNGKELRSYDPSELKAYFSVAYQDFARYPLTLKENIQIGGQGDLQKALHQLELQSLDLHTPLGKQVEGGIDLSGGQWQRVALARTLMNPAPIKILDEPTSALDPLSETRLYGQFEALMKGSTSIFISHRLGSIKLADEIFVFNSGKVTEIGSHSKLMKSRGTYQKMYQSQLKWYQEQEESA